MIKIQIKSLGHAFGFHWIKTYLKDLYYFTSKERINVRSIVFAYVHANCILKETKAKCRWL